MTENPRKLIAHFSLRRAPERALLLVILLGYLGVAGLYAVFTPAWQSPDEPAHYNYVAQVAWRGCCPVIEPGDWNAPYQDELKAAHFRADLLAELDTIQYEDHQPPLYYLLASLVYKLTDGSLIALRLFSALVGLLVVLSAYGIGRALLPDRPHIGLGAAALTAFLPQHVALLASVNNDSLGWALAGVTLLATVVYLKKDETTAQRRSGAKFVENRPAIFASSRFNLILGLLVGAGFVAKASTYFLGALAPLAILLKWRSGQGAAGGPRRRVLLRELALFLLPALILGGVWWARNIGVYGFPDFLGLRAHDQVVADQPRTAERIAAIGFGSYVSESLQTTFNSFWGQFGWMALPMPGWIYTALLGLTAAALAGFGVDRAILQRQNPRTSSPESAGGAGEGQRRAWLILILAALLAMLQYIYYNTEFLQLQGRYLFTGLIPFALGLTLGVDAWRRLILGRFPWSRWLTASAFLPLAALDVYLLGRFIVPLLSP